MAQSSSCYYKLHAELHMSAYYGTRARKGHQIRETLKGFYTNKNSSLTFKADRKYFEPNKWMPLQPVLLFTKVLFNHRGKTMCSVSFGVHYQSCSAFAFRGGLLKLVICWFKRMRVGINDEISPVCPGPTIKGSLKVEWPGSLASIYCTPDNKKRMGMMKIQTAAKPLTLVESFKASVETIL